MQPYPLTAHPAQVVTKTIGAYEAKTHLPQLLRQVQEGESFEISVRGHAVARLVPVAADQATEQLRHAASAAMRVFMLAQRDAGAGADTDLRALIEEGRA